MTLRIFRDSVTPQLIPLDGTDGVLAYANGHYTWPQSQITRFAQAGKQIARIDVIGNAPRQASILDVERFDATPQTARTWVPERNAFRGDAVIYCSRANLDELFAALAGESYWLLVADWTGAPHELGMPLPPGVKMLGTQYANTPAYDVSAIYADGWHPVTAAAAKR